MIYPVMYFVLKYRRITQENTTRQCIYIN